MDANKIVELIQRLQTCVHTKVPYVVFLFNNIYYAPEIDIIDDDGCKSYMDMRNDIGYKPFADGLKRLEELVNEYGKYSNQG